MTARFALLISVLVATAAVVLVALLPSGSDPADPAATHPADTTSAARLDLHRAGANPTPAGPMATRTRWRLRYDFEARQGYRPPMVGRLSGTWVTAPLADGRVAVRIEGAHLEGLPAQVPAEAFAIDAELVPGPGGDVLAAVGFPGEPPPAAIQRVYAELASLSWLSPGSGRAWTVTEEGPLGPYLARYRRDGDAVTRSATGLTARRTAAGPSQLGLDALTYDHQARFAFDEAGLARIEVDVHMVEPGERGRGRTAYRMHLELERLDAEQVPVRAGVTDPTSLAALFDPGALRRGSDLARVKHGDIARWLADVDHVATLDPSDRAVRTARLDTLSALAAMVRLDPAVAAVLADDVRAHPDDVSRGALVLGALRSAGTPEGIDALAGLVTDDTLHRGIRRNAIDHIALGHHPTHQAIDALVAALEGPDVAVAATAIGAQVRQLAETEPDTADELMEMLLARATGARGDLERIDALHALGNSGSPLALPYLRGLTAASNPAVAQAAIFALRFIPGEAADAMLAGMLDVGGERGVSAIRAIAFRDPAVWRARLEAAQFGEGSRAAAEVGRVLATWM